jgi:hypothetical protein
MDLQNLDFNDMAFMRVAPAPIHTASSSKTVKATLSMKSLKNGDIAYVKLTLDMTALGFVDVKEGDSFQIDYNREHRVIRLTLDKDGNVTLDKASKKIGRFASNRHIIKLSHATFGFVTHKPLVCATEYSRGAAYLQVPRIQP